MRQLLHFQNPLGCFFEIRLEGCKLLARKFEPPVSTKLFLFEGAVPLEVLYLSIQMGVIIKNLLETLSGDSHLVGCAHANTVHYRSAIVI